MREISLYRLSCLVNWESGVYINISSRTVARGQNVREEQTKQKRGWPFASCVVEEKEANRIAGMKENNQQPMPERIEETINQVDSLPWRTFPFLTKCWRSIDRHTAEKCSSWLHLNYCPFHCLIDIYRRRVVRLFAWLAELGTLKVLRTKKNNLFSINIFVARSQ